MPGRSVREAGAMTLEAAASILIILLGFGGTMEIVGASFESDRMERAAHAAARTVALNPSHPDPHQLACAAIRAELDLDPAFDCWSAWDGLPAYKNVETGVRPEDLPDPLNAGVGSANGDLVLVRIPWRRDTFSAVAMGLARAEP